jgi:hypothetical protein
MKQQFAHIQPLASLFRDSIRGEFGPAGPVGMLADINTWECSPHGIVAEIRGGAASFLRAPGSFGVIRGITVALGETCEALTAAFTQTNCGEMYEVLRGMERRPLSVADRDFLCADPRLRPEAEIRAAFLAKDWPMGLLDLLLPLVRARCQAVLNPPAPMWRKAFGFALVLTGPSSGGTGYLRILPVAHLGATGVVEAHGGVMLGRIHQDASLVALQLKGLEYAAVGRKLSSVYGGGVPSATQLSTADSNPVLGPAPGGTGVCMP